MAKLTKCRTCGADIATNARVCPQCGAKIKHSIYKRWWFWLVIVVFIGFWALGRSGGETADAGTQPRETSTKPAVETTAPDIREGIALTVPEQTIYTENGVTITVKGAEKTRNGWNINLFIENDSTLNLGFNAHAYAVNGIMTRNSIYAMDCDVAAGKKANTALEIKNSFLAEYEISEIHCVDVLFWAYDNDEHFKEFDSGQLEIKADSYTGNHDNIRGDSVFADSGIVVDYLGRNGDSYDFAITNTTGAYLSFDFANLSVNDFTDSATDYDLYNEVLLNDSQIVVTVKVSNDFKQANGIDAVQHIEWSLNLRPYEDHFSEYKVGPIVFSVY